MKYIGKCTPAWSMLERKFQKTVQEKNNLIYEENGPGKYNIVGTEKYKYKNGPKWSMGNKYKQKQQTKNDEQFSNSSADEIQDKNDYKLFNIQKQKRSQSTFGISQRFKTKTKQVPPPDTYNLNSCFQNIKRLDCNISSRNYKQDNIKKNVIEPPIQYDIKNNNWIKGRKVYFKQYKQQIRKCQSQDKLSINKKKNIKNQQKSQTKRSNSTFGIQQRLKNQNKHQVPINYDLQKIEQYYKKTKHYSFGKKYKQQKKNYDGPKSGYYKFENFGIKKNIGCSFGISDRFNKNNKENISINYQQNHSQRYYRNKSSKQKGYIFSSDQRLKIMNNQNPGPGKYLITSQFNKNNKEQKISYPVLSLKKKEDLPGPGSYNPSIKFKDKKGKTIFGNKFKQKFRQTCDKFYDTQIKIGQKGNSFGKGKRFQKKKKSILIGPEFYDLKSTIPQIQPWMNCYTEDQLIIQYIIYLF